jgi:hypothetical protein
LGYVTVPPTILLFSSSSSAGYYQPTPQYDPGKGVVKLPDGVDEVLAVVLAIVLAVVAAALGATISIGS